MAGSVGISACNGGDRHAGSKAAPPADSLTQGSCEGVPLDLRSANSEECNGGVARPLQPLADKRAPLPAFRPTPASPTPAKLPHSKADTNGAGLKVGRGGGEGSAERGYLDTPIGTSSVEVYKGTTREGFALLRRRRRAKLIVQMYHTLIAAGRGKQAKALIGCGRWFRKFRSPCGSLHLEPFPCDSIFCPECADRRSKKLQKQVLAKVNRPGKSYWLLTLTVPNEPYLTRRFISQLVEWFAELRESYEWRVIPLAKGEAGGISGGVYSIEATFNRERGDWHPHLHILIEAPKVLPRWWIFSIRARWEQITEGAKVVHLARVFGVAKDGRRLKRKLNERGLRELVKYATKCADFADSPERVDEFLNAFRNVRRIQSFGSFFGVEQAAEREPGLDDVKPVGCECGRCVALDFIFEPGLVHISETIVGLDGRRQLRFDFVREMRDAENHSPPAEDLVLEPAPVAAGEQIAIEFHGFLPEQGAGSPSLFPAEIYN